MFRSVRFGATDSHGRANVVAFNSLQKFGAFTREPSGKYRVDMAKMRDGADSLAARIIRIQGNDDYEDAGLLNAEFGKIGPVLQGDLNRLGRSRFRSISFTSNERCFRATRLRMTVDRPIYGMLMAGRKGFRLRSRATRRKNLGTAPWCNWQHA